jgi:hypothetical protein
MLIGERLADRRLLAVLQIAGTASCIKNVCMVDALLSQRVRPRFLNILASIFLGPLAYPQLTRISIKHDLDLELGSTCFCSLVLYTPGRKLDSELPL